MIAGPRLGTMLLVLAGCGAGLELPPEVASSKYIAFHADADASVICMDDLLAREDRFIERTAELLGVEPPTATIDYVWDPAPEGSEPWACAAGSDCYKHSHEGDLSLVVSRKLINHHELVHAVDQQALGSSAHWTLREGLAEYLGSLDQTSPNPADFPAALRALIARGEQADDYALAMHFVGSIFAGHGAEKFRALRAKVPADARLEQFAAAFAAEYGQSLDDALAAMAVARVQGQDVFRGCGEGEAPVLAWADASTIDTTIESACGDPWFYGGGFAGGQAGFYGWYVVEVPREGPYELIVAGREGGPAPLRALLTGCSFDLAGAGLASFAGQAARGSLQAGRYTLAIAFPQRPEARGEATVRLEYLGP